LIADFISGSSIGISVHKNENGLKSDVLLQTDSLGIGKILSPIFKSIIFRKPQSIPDAF